MEQAMNDGGLDVGDMWDVASEWSSPRRPWLDRFLRLLDQRLAGGAAESHPEVVLGEALRRGGVIGLVRQHRIDLPGYGRARFDLAIPHLRWAIEADLFPTHRETIGRWRDADRDEAALAIGWATTRVGPEEFGASFERTVEELVDEYHGRSAAARQLRSDQR
jgi:very-short-patch-repair endonuclease